MKLVQRIVLQYYRTKLRLLSMVSNEKAATAAFHLFCTPYTRKRTDKPSYIFDRAEKLSLVIQDIKVLGFKWMPAENHNGHTVLICHGFDSNSYRFSDYIIDLLDQGFAVIAFDAPAHGISSGKTITVLIYVEMIEKIKSNFGPLDGIMAHSFGGLAAVLALEKKNNIGCKKLVLVSPSTETTYAMDKFIEYLKLTSEVRQKFYELIYKTGGNPAAWYSVARAIEAIDVDTLWIHDRLDKITPYQHMEHLVIKKLPHIKFEITENLGHSPYRDGRVKHRIVSFLAGML